MPITSQSIADSMLKSIETSTFTPQPYKHWFLRRCLPEDAVDAILDLRFEAPPLAGISGKRELHNSTRTYFDADNMDRFSVCRAFNDAQHGKHLHAEVGVGHADLGTDIYDASKTPARSFSFPPISPTMASSRAGSAACASR